MTAPTIVILAAGQGTRMRSATPKVLHPLCGRPLVTWPVLAAREAGAGRIVVVDSAARRLAGHLPEGVVLAVQEQPRGTADAVEAAGAEIPEDGPVVILSGDVPLVTAEFIRDLLRAHAEGGAAATMATMELDDPAGYGRVVRDASGAVDGVVETKKPGDATPEQLAIREVNTGIFAFDAQALRVALRHVTADNAQGERYLPDVLPILRAAGHRLAAHLVDDADLTLGINDRADLAAVRTIAQARIHRELMLAGVTIVDPASTTIDAGVSIGPDTVVEPFCTITGDTRIGSGCRIGAHSTIADADLADDVTVRQSWLDSCVLHAGATVGPFAYLRPGALLREGAKAGTFVEIKNADIGAGSKVPHLSYIGDADVGERTNLGAATITANYDGTHKHRTRIGSDVRGGVDTTLVAPVSVGDGAWTAAGSVVTDDVPAGGLAIARGRQRNVEAYAERRREAAEAAEAARGDERVATPAT
ncbi:MAG: bifunctional UDP-N-acetylglucosamine pyrophosphorylase / glucosamine-phosphate N-acetyltransferase [Solirubrobacteraceae bacterium]|nr:bifunctional UDP-N-acetylglucosamine pyrophosphorylase / glucosamine-phosphate N-acetyltransferase [Solirubrobacteraceae bacterium]